LDNLDNAKKQKKQKQSIKTRTMEDQLIKENEMKNILNNFVAELHCASDKRKKNKSNWKFTKRVVVDNCVLLYVYGKTHALFDMSDEDNYSVTIINKKCNGGSCRIIINLTSNTYKKAMVTSDYDYYTWEKLTDTLLYYETHSYSIDPSNPTYRQIKEYFN